MLYQTLDRKIVAVSLPRLPFHVLPAVATPEDCLLFEHFTRTLSQILTIGVTEKDNPWTGMILPMAVNHKGLMHSLLGLSASHLIRVQPSEGLEQRKRFHCNDAISIMAQDVSLAIDRNADVEDPIVACMILQYLIPVTDGATEGEHRPHLEAAKNYIKFRVNEDFGKFAHEFHQYYIMSDAVTSLHKRFEDMSLDDDFGPISFLSGSATLEHPVMVGVSDGLWRFIMQISQLRTIIRRRKYQKEDPFVSFSIILQATELTKQLKDWQSCYEEWTLRWLRAELYREATLVFLHRTIRSPESDPDLTTRVDRGLMILTKLLEEHATQCILLPTFLLGCAAFGCEQRVKIDDILNKLEDYSRQGNIAPTRMVIREVWKLMDAGDKQCWDWESIMNDMNIDISVT